jgi:hypothetical protein
MPKDERVEVTATDAEITRNFQIKAAAAQHKLFKQNEVALKKLYVDWLFDNLSLERFK